MPIDALLNVENIEGTCPPAPSGGAHATSFAHVIYSSNVVRKYPLVARLGTSRLPIFRPASAGGSDGGVEVPVSIL